MGGATFVQTYVLLRPTILQACMTLLSNEMEAEDVTQDALLGLREQHVHLDEVASPKAYAIHIACSKYIDTLRMPAQRPHNTEEPTELEMPLVITTPQEDLVAQEQLAHVNGWIATLPGQRQKVWWLRQEMVPTNDETVQRMGLQEVIARSMMSRLRKEARKFFADTRE